MFVTLFLFCLLESPATHPTTHPSIIIGQLDRKIIPESSGLVASQKHPGVYWTHNDSGNAPEIFAIDAHGKLLQRFAIQGRNRDWEDISIDDQDRLYISDMGNNTSQKMTPYINRLAEPDPTHAADKPLVIEKQWSLTYPDKPFDCESLFILNGRGYCISKRRDFGLADLYEFDLPEAGGTVPMKKIAGLPILSPVTAACLSPDKKQLAIMTVGGPFLFDVPKEIAAIGKSIPKSYTYGRIDMEAVCFTPEGLLATREEGDVMLFPFELLK